MSLRTNPYLLLIRPANLITSATDIIAGAALATMFVTDTGSGDPSTTGFIFLLLSSLFLYAGGISMNDVLDYKLDLIERPERPLPGGRISVQQAAVYSIALLLMGILLAFVHHSSSRMLALAIAFLSFVYNKWSKHHPFAGPLNMGILRGLNLLLGLSLIPGLLYDHYAIALIPVVYIFAITMVSRGEVRGSSRLPLYAAFALFLLTDAGILSFGIVYDRIWLPVLFVLLHLLYILPPLYQAIQSPSPEDIKRTVVHGVLGIILLDAIWVSMTGYWWLAFLLLLLLPLSQKLGRYFSVT